MDAGSCIRLEGLTCRNPDKVAGVEEQLGSVSLRLVLFSSLASPVPLLHPGGYGRKNYQNRTLQIMDT